jgi:hypothetical protein
MKYQIKEIWGVFHPQYRPWWWPFWFYFRSGYSDSKVAYGNKVAAEDHIKRVKENKKEKPIIHKYE